MAQGNNIGSGAGAVATFIRGPVPEEPLDVSPAKPMSPETIPYTLEESVQPNPLAAPYKLRGVGPWKKEE